MPTVTTANWFHLMSANAKLHSPGGMTQSPSDHQANSVIKTCKTAILFLNRICQSEAKCVVCGRKYVLKSYSDKIKVSHEPHSEPVESILRHIPFL
jgi:hypothetical protein